MTVFNNVLDVAHFLVLGFKVSGKRILERDFSGDAFGDGDAGGLQGGDFVGIVGDESDLGDAKELEGFGWQFVGATVGGESELDIGFNGVKTVVLQLVSFELGHQTDSTALLLLVEEDACASRCDFGKSHFELKPAIAAQRAEDISCEALRVDAHQRCRGVDVAHHQDDEFFGLRPGLGWTAVSLGEGRSFKAEYAEGSPAGGEVGFGDLINALECHASILLASQVGGGGQRSQRPEGKQAGRSARPEPIGWGRFESDRVEG